MPEQLDAKARLEAWAESKNLTSELDESGLSELGNRVVTEYEIDDASRIDWMKTYEDSMRIVNMIVSEKHIPWDGAANVIYPLIATAAIQFNARALPSIIQNSSIVKGRVVGKDTEGEKAARAQRVGEHMSYQLSEEMEEWVEDMDKMLTTLSVTGCEFKKTWQDNITNRPVSEFVSAKNVVVNNSAKSLERAPRITYLFELLPHEIEERIRSGRFIDFEYGISTGKDTADLDSPHEFFEQHRRWDIDKDGYPEPVIVTVHKTTKKVVRITARFDVSGVHVNSRNQVVMIEPVQYFTKFSFLRSFDGTFYDVGYGFLLTHTNKTISTLVNQLLDAGTDQITGGGLIAGDINIKGGKQGGEIRFSPGKYYNVNITGDDIRKRIWPRHTAQPSPVTFSLLQLLISSSEKLVSSSEILAGTPPPANTPATTTLAMIEQGMKLFSSIFGRIHRALSSEFTKIYRLNRLYLDDEVYFRVMDNEKAIRRADYDVESCDVIPVSDPNNTTDAQKMMKAEALWQLRGQGLNDEAIKRRYLEALQIGEIDDLMPDPEAANQPTPEVQMGMEKIKIERERLEIERETANVESIRIRADALRLLAEAESKEIGTQMETYKQQVRDLESELWLSKRGKPVKENVDNENPENGMGGMDIAPGDRGIPTGSEPIEGAGVEPPVTGANAQL